MTTSAPTATDSHENLEELEQQLRQYQRMASLGELVGTTAHEFNNVLMTIINYAKLGLRNTDADVRERAFDRILTASRRAERITNGVLGYARNNVDEFAATDLAQMIEQVLVLMEREMHRYRVSVETELDEVPPAWAIGGQIQQVLLNLLTNARQAMPRGGRIIIGLAASESDGMLEMSIRDTGSGIPNEQLPRIFDRFYSTKDGPDASGKGGTGVGLSACKQIIESHRGRIRVQSEVGKGTKFTLFLPTAPA